MDFGWLSLIPPIVAIVIAFITRKIIPSLFLGVIIGTTIFHNGSVILASKEAIAIFWKNAEIANFSSWQRFQGSWHLFILLFCFILGSIMHLIDKAGGAKAYGQWALRKIKTRAQASLSTMLLGIIIFFDDYFNCLTVGAVMRSVTDKFSISRAKLAYIIDSTTAPVCILAPVSSWVVYVISEFGEAGLKDNAFSIFINTLLFNFYAWLSLLTVFLVCAFDIHIGPMKRHEEQAKNKQEDTTTATDETHNIYDLIFPITLLITTIILGMLYTGNAYILGGENTIIIAFQKMHAGKAMFWGGLFSLIITCIYFLIRRVFSYADILKMIFASSKSMFPVLLTLVLSWSIGTVISQKLQTGKYLAQFLNDGSLKFLLPLIIFILGCITAFATGSSWGTFAIMIPIVVPIAQELDTSFLVPMLSASLAGAIYGDHCSPISDTTILSSIGAGCEHMDHVVTQAPYSTIVAGVSGVCFFSVGFTISFGTLISSAIGFSIGIVLLLGVLFLVRGGLSK